MSIFDIRGNEIYSGWRYAGNYADIIYNLDGDIIPFSEYSQYNDDYQHSILLARNDWETEYRTDDAIPIVLTTDQHGRMTASGAGRVYEYLSRALKWNEISSCLNLGDVCSSQYTKSTLDNMVSVLESVPKAKQINVAGNHDVQGIHTESESMDTMFDEYFNNSAYNKSIRFQHRGFETMIDEAYNIRYICIGSWDYIDDVYYHYNISTSSIAWLIETMESVDNYDIILLSHVQTSRGYIDQFNPAVDGEQFQVQTVQHTGVDTAGYSVAISQLIAARKRKESGTFTDSSGYVHSYDFSNCTSDILCTLHGHYHHDSYNYGGIAPAIVFDAYTYLPRPFYLINVNRTKQYVKVWKIDENAVIQTYVVPFAEHINQCTGISMNLTSATLAVGQTLTLEAMIDTEYQNDGTYPEWVTNWSTTSSAIATVSDGIVTGNMTGTCIISARCQNEEAQCVVTVT